MDEETPTLTAENAVTLNHDFVGHLSKYRAVELPFSHDVSQICLGTEVSNGMQDVYHYVELNSQFKKPQQLSRLPQSRTCIEPATPSSSGSLRCPEKPCFTPPNTSFHANESQFDKVKESIERALEAMEDYDWSYFEADCLWKAKYFHGSNLREKYIYCYWDSKVEDHLIEVKRVRGDGVNISTTVDFLTKLKAVVTNTEEQELSHVKRRNLRAPLPFTLPATTTALPMISSETPQTAPSTSSGLPKLPLPKLTRGGGGMSLKPLPMTNFTPTEVTTDQFLSGIKPILSMARDAFYEPRLEAAKMLCDLATKEPKYIELADCQELCLQSLESLLFDEFEEVRQFAVMAFASFAEVESYRSLFLRLRGLESLLALIRNSPREYPAYQTAQMRRKAALGMSLVATSHPQAVKQRLMNVGYETEQSWRDHCCSILDKRTREAAMKISVVFK